MAEYNLTSQFPSRLFAGDVLNIPYSGQCVTITLPRGIYKLEAWGAYGPYSSASPATAHSYGNGGYAAGQLALKSALTLHCYVGGMPLSTPKDGYYYGGYNGGGSKLYSTNYRDNGPGGGATDFCLVKGRMLLDYYRRYVREEESYLSRILVAGGGGGGRSNNAVSQGGYAPCATTSGNAYYGGMTAPGTVASSTASFLGGFGFGSVSINASDDRAAGGGGWYGGGDAGDSYGGGGSSFAWCDTYAGYVPSGYSVGAEHKLSNVTLALGSENPSPAGLASDGYARITVIAVDVLPEMIFDRTQADADRWQELISKLDSGGWTSLTTAERSEWLTALKGAYNFTDLQRVSRSVDFLAERFVTLISHLVESRACHGVASDGLFAVPYSEDDVVVNPYLAWSRSTVVKDSNMKQYLADLRLLRELLTLPTDAPRVPPDMADLTIDEANDIEKLLFMVDVEISHTTDYKDKLIRDTADAWCFSGDLLSAEV